MAERVKELRTQVLDVIAELPLELLGRAGDPTGIVVVQPRGGGAAQIVQRAWDEDRVVIKHVADQGMDAIRISFWALHRNADVDALAASLARQLAVRV